MKFVDAHVHLSDSEYSENIVHVLAEAKEAGVVALVSNSMDYETSKGSLDLASRNSGFVFAALGIHPWTVKIKTHVEFDKVRALISSETTNKALVAIGEIGLDSKYMEVWDKQLLVFEGMLKLAEKLGLPTIIHSRGTTLQIIDMLPSYRIRRVLLHWFSNPIAALDRAVNAGYFISEGPPSVYLDGIRDVIRRVPLTNLLTETDGPVKYFKEPFKGKLTTPAFIPNVIRAIAEIKKISVEEVASQVASNFQDFFGINLQK
jgi:TatD DNase family protein